ncbi:MAG: hypothetical protein WBG11_05935 [Methylocella sp.]
MRKIKPKRTTPYPSERGRVSIPGAPAALIRNSAPYPSVIGTSPLIFYAHMPFGNLSVRQVSGQPSPNGDAVTDAGARAREALCFPGANRVPPRPAV